MAAPLLDHIISQACGVSRAATDDRSDAALLTAFLADRSETAFAEIVRRHGPMVRDVCRRVVRHHPDADDAFQATFLVLVRKADTIRPREMLGNWLYGVALRTARHVRTRLARSRNREVPMTEPAVADPAPDTDLSAVLDRELSRLPDRYRLPIVVCDLEGKTRKEAAAQLGWPEGTVAGRLARGRAMLAKRLLRLGVAPSVAAAGAAGVGAMSQAAVPLAASVCSKALLGTASPAVTAIADVVAQSLTWAKWKSVAVGLVVFCVLTAGTGFAGYEAHARGRPRFRPVRPPLAKQHPVPPAPVIPQPPALPPVVIPEPPSDDPPVRPEPDQDVVKARERYSRALNWQNQHPELFKADEIEFSNMVNGLKENLTPKIHRLDAQTHEYSMFLIADFYYVRREYVVAEKSLEAALHEYPDGLRNIMARYLLGRCAWYQAANQSGKLQDGTLSEPEREAARNNYKSHLSKALKRLSNLEEILTDNTRVAELETQVALSQPTAFAIAECHFYLENFEEAERRYMRLSARCTGTVKQLVALSQLWQCYKHYLNKPEKAALIVQQLAVALDALPDQAFDGSMPICNRAYWRDWLKAADQTRP